MTKNIIKKNLTKLEPSATLAINEESKKLIAQTHLSTQIMTCYTVSLAQEQEI